MSILLSPGKKFCQSISRARYERLCSTTNKKHQIQFLIDSSIAVNTIATSKLNYRRIQSENHLISKGFSLLAIKNYLRHYSTQKQTVNILAVSHHLFTSLLSQKRTNSEYKYEKWSVNHPEKKIGFPLVLLFLMIIGTITEVYAETSPSKPVNDPPQHIKAILNTEPQDRSSEDVMELFNYLHDEGEKEAKKAKDKDVVIVFGDTGAGKSTLINFLWGCTIRKNSSDPRLIEVDPESAVPEVAPIGLGPSSCTLIPTMVGDLKEVDIKDLSEIRLSFYDMPGLSDNRGFEVDLATAITMKKIVENAKSVKFVMVYEYPIKSVKGAGWAQVASLFTERFRGTPWQGDKSLSLVITNTPQDIDIAAIKSDIKKYTRAGSEDLSDYACIYDPLNPKDRFEQLSIVNKIKNYQRRDIKIVLKKDQLWESRVLGDKIEKEVYADLENDKIDTARNKIKFAYGIAELGNADLTKILKTALDGVHSYLDYLISTMEKRGNSPESKYPYLKKYKKIKENFGPYTKFERHDSDATNVRNQISDERLIAWDKPKAVLVGGVATVGTGAATGVGVAVALGASTTTLTAASTLATASAGVSALSGLSLAAAVSTAVAAAPVIAVLGGLATVGCLGFTAYSGLCWLRPSQKDVVTSAYFDTQI